jgi:TRAP-type transport system periplasmic protein
MTTSLRFIRKTLATALIAAASVTSAISAQAETLRMGMVTPPSHIWNKVSERFNTNLEAATGNKSKIRIFPLSKLGGEDQMIDLLQSGGMQLAILTAGSLSNREPSISGWFLPYQFADVTAAAKGTESAEARAMLKALETHKMIGLGYTMAGMRHVLSTKPMTSVDDFANKKIRSFPNRVFNDWWGQLGAAPTALAISDVSPALTTNLLDAVDVDLDIVVGLKMYQQAPYLTLTNHMAFPGIVVASQVWWNKLSADQQKVVMDAFKEAEAWGFKEQAAAEVSNLERLKKEGVTVNSMSAELFKAATDTIVSQYTAENEGIKRFHEQNQ